MDPTIPLELIHGHLVFTLNGKRWLLDTGSPESFGLEATNPLLQNSPLQPCMGGLLNPESLSSYVGCPLDGLIGTDTLNHFDVEINLPSGFIRFSKDHIVWHEPDAFFEHNLVFSDRMPGIPLMRAVCSFEKDFCHFWPNLQHGEDMAALDLPGAEYYVFDTGAKYSYNQMGIEGFFPAGIPLELHDFWPPMGKFKTEGAFLCLSFPTPLHSIAQKVDRDYCLTGQNQTVLTVGLPPAKLNAHLERCGVRGIIGNELIRNQACIYSARRNKLTFLDSFLRK